jgi:hypothetical protein
MDPIAAKGCSSPAERDAVWSAAWQAEPVETKFSSSSREDHFAVRSLKRNLDAWQPDRISSSIQRGVWIDSKFPFLICPEVHECGSLMIVLHIFCGRWIPAIWWTFRPARREFSGAANLHRRQVQTLADIKENPLRPVKL